MIGKLCRNTLWNDRIISAAITKMFKSSELEIKRIAAGKVEWKKGQKMDWNNSSLFNRRLVKPAVEILGLDHIYDHMRILLPHQMNDIIHFIGGNHCVEQIHFAVAVASHSVHTGYCLLYTSPPDISIIPMLSTNKAFLFILSSPLTPGLI